MKYYKWKPLYNKIIEDFQFSYERDIEAANILNDLLKNNKTQLIINKLRDFLFNQDVIILGAGSSLENGISKYKQIIDKNIKIATNGTTTALISRNIIPDLIVTDLDGRVSDQLESNSKGSIAIVHAHGDNINQLMKYVPLFRGEVIGTTQVDSSKYNFLYNFGGFTDGDRAVFIADHFNVNQIYLIGYDFNNRIGKYSFTSNKKLKIKKLRWCKNLINMINTKNNIHFL
jgi:uncharacterized Rossmann fold enzyme